MGLTNIFVYLQLYKESVSKDLKRSIKRHIDLAKILPVEHTEMVICSSPTTKAASGQRCFDWKPGLNHQLSRPLPHRKLTIYVFPYKL